MMGLTFSMFLAYLARLYILIGKKIKVHEKYWMFGDFIIFWLQPIDFILMNCVLTLPPFYQIWECFPFFLIYHDFCKASVR